MTESVIRTNNPPSAASRASTRRTIAIPEMAPPRANEPTSPINIFAGAAFHQRNPAQDPASAAESTAISSGSRTL